MALAGVCAFAQGAGGKISYAARLNQSIVDLAEVGCLTVEPSKLVYARKTYDPSAVERVLSVHPVLKTQMATCKWGLAITIVIGENFGVTNHGEAAKYLVSPNICEWNSSGQNLNPNRCLAKTIYVFSGKPQPIELFELGLTAIKQPQEEKVLLFKQGPPL